MPAFRQHSRPNDLVLVCRSSSDWQPQLLEVQKASRPDKCHANGIVTPFISCIYMLSQGQPDPLCSSSTTFLPHPTKSEERAYFTASLQCFTWLLTSSSSLTSHLSAELLLLGLPSDVMFLGCSSILLLTVLHKADGWLSSIHRLKFF